MRRLAVFILLVLFLIVGVLASFWAAPSVERDLAKSIGSKLTGANTFPDLDVEIDGRFVVLGGSVESEAAKLAAIEQVDNVLGHLDIMSADVGILPAQSPYTFDVSKSSDGRVVLTGFAPNESARQTILLRAQELYDADRLTWNLDLAAGMPDLDWLLMVDRGMESVSQLVEGRAQLEDQKLSISGTAENEEFARRVVTTVQRDLPEQYRNQGSLDIGSLPPVFDPYLLSIDKQADAISVRGVVPNEAFARSLVEQVSSANPGSTVSPQLVVGRGMPSRDWPSDVSNAAVLLSNFDQGRVLFEGQKMLVEGLVDAGEPAKAVAAKLTEFSTYELTTNISVVDRDVAQTPVSEQSSPSSDEQPTDTAAEPETALSEGDSASDSESAGEAAVPDGSENSAQVAPQTENAGDIEIDVEASFTAELWFDGSTTTVNGFSIPNLVAAPSDAACERWFAWRQRDESIEFDVGSAALSASSGQLLNEIFAVLSACLVAGDETNGRGVRVVGHTDSTGSADGNKTLSEERAKSVLQALVERGIAAEVLSASGLGGESPIASNETEEGRARNRRIEFELYAR